MPKRTHPVDPDAPTLKTAADGKRRHINRSPWAMATAQNPGDGSRRLRNPRHEKVARLVAIQEMEPIEAFIEVYDPERKRKREQNRVQANRVCTATPSVVARIQYLTELKVNREIEKHELTRDWVIEKLIHLWGHAIDEGQLPTAAKALELLGTEQGMFVKKSHTEIEHRRAPLDASGPRELVERFIHLAQQAFGTAIPREELERLFFSRLGILTVDPVPEEAPPALPNGSGEAPHGD